LWRELTRPGCEQSNSGSKSPNVCTKTLAVSN
jgi:hypothetical protein